VVQQDRIVAVWLLRHFNRRSEMNIPGFTADASAYTARNRYRAVRLGSGTSKVMVGLAAGARQSSHGPNCYWNCLRSCDDDPYYCHVNCHCYCRGGPPACEYQ
jgi:hypothetical protein